MARTKTQRRAKIKARIRSKVLGTSDKPRLCIYRSNKAVYAQIIDDTKGTTLLAGSSQGVKGSKVEASKEAGKKLAEAAAANGIADVKFDRNGYLYHGRIKSFAEGAREGGLKF